MEIIDGNHAFGVKMADFAEIVYTIPNVPTQI